MAATGSDTTDGAELCRRDKSDCRELAQSAHFPVDNLSLPVTCLGALQRARLPPHPGLTRGVRPLSPTKPTDEKKPKHFCLGFLLITSLTITYFHTGCSTIIGVISFHGPVRDGKGWYRVTMVIRHNLYRSCSQRGSNSLNLEEVSFVLLGNEYESEHATAPFFLSLYLLRL